MGEQIAHALTDGLAVFQKESTAGWLFTLLVGATLVLAAIYFRSSIEQPLRALDAARRTLTTLTFVDAADARFHGEERQTRLDAAVEEAARRSPVGYRILLAWRRRNAALAAGLPTGEEAVLRPSAVLGPQPRWLGTAADALVGTGLVFTFLGLVAAIGAASAAVASDTEPRAALIALLGAASVKFLTSIAGLGGSLILRVWQAFWLGRIASGCVAVSEALDRHLLAVRRG